MSKSQRYSMLRMGVVMLLVSLCALRMSAQNTAETTMTVSVVDATGAAIQTARVTARNEAAHSTRVLKFDGEAHFVGEHMPTGRYTIEAKASGFQDAQLRSVELPTNNANEFVVRMEATGTSQTVDVTADGYVSPATEMSPVKAQLDARSARSQVSTEYIDNYTSPVSDYGEVAQAVPGVYTTSSNGVGLGQSKTYFRGFADGSYDIDYDGIPFYDTNTPSHHSWAFFPAQWIGGVDFDRSPGSAATIGPTPFGGSIHLLSRDLKQDANMRLTSSFGSFNTQLYDVAMDSGDLLGKDASLFVDVHRMKSDGYQTYNSQMRNAGSLKFQYKLGEQSLLTAYTGVIVLDSHTPNFNGETRAQIAQYGDSYLMTNNSDPTLYTDYKYNFYHVPTDFSYIGLKTDFGNGWTMDLKPYSYRYFNHQNYANSYLISDDAAYVAAYNKANKTSYVTCSTPVTKKGVTALPCAVDKLNSYRKYGETLAVNNVSRFGVLRMGLWYEWARTNRYQDPSDPLNHWADQVLPNFHERFWTDSTQPYMEFELHASNKLTITPGVKWAIYSLNLQQYADNGKTVGSLGGAAWIWNQALYRSVLPSIDVNYRILRNWSAYAQLSTGSVVPPSSVFDYNQTVSKSNPTPGIETFPKPTRATTYQAGSVFKTQRLMVDFDFYHTRFQNAYSRTTDATTGEQVNYLQPSSLTRGMESEANFDLHHGLSLYGNLTVGKATYIGSQTVSGVTFKSPDNMWVAQTPANTEGYGVLYARHDFNIGLTGKRIGHQYLDNGSYHNQYKLDAFQIANLSFGYTMRGHGVFKGTGVKVSINNLTNNHALTNVSLANAVANIPVTNGVANPFIGTTAISQSDILQKMAARSVMVTLTFGLSPSRKQACGKQQMAGANSSGHS